MNAGLFGAAQHSAPVSELLESLTPRKVIVNSKGGELGLVVC